MLLLLNLANHDLLKTYVQHLRALVWLYCQDQMPPAATHPCQCIIDSGSIFCIEKSNCCENFILMAYTSYAIQRMSLFKARFPWQLYSCIHLLYKQEYSAQYVRINLEDFLEFWGEGGGGGGVGPEIMLLKPSDKQSYSI